jgi:hypothetical protein
MPGHPVCALSSFDMLRMRTVECLTANKKPSVADLIGESKARQAMQDDAAGPGMRTNIKLDLRRTRIDTPVVP